MAGKQNFPYGAAHPERQSPRKLRHKTSRTCTLLGNFARIYTAQPSHVPHHESCAIALSLALQQQAAAAAGLGGETAPMPPPHHQQQPQQVQTHRREAWAVQPHTHPALPGKRKDCEGEHDEAGQGLVASGDDHRGHDPASVFQMRMAAARAWQPAPGPLPSAAGGGGSTHPATTSAPEHRAAADEWRAAGGGPSASGGRGGGGGRSSIMAPGPPPPQLTRWASGPVQHQAGVWDLGVEQHGRSGAEQRLRSYVSQPMLSGLLPDPQPTWDHSPRYGTEAMPGANPGTFAGGHGGCQPPSWEQQQQEQRRQQQQLPPASQLRRGWQSAPAPHLEEASHWEQHPPPPQLQQQLEYESYQGTAHQAQAAAAQSWAALQPLPDHSPGVDRPVEVPEAADRWRSRAASTPAWQLEDICAPPHPAPWRDPPQQAALHQPPAPLNRSWGRLHNSISAPTDVVASTPSDQCDGGGLFLKSHTNRTQAARQTPNSALAPDILESWSHRLDQHLPGQLVLGRGAVPLVVDENSPGQWPSRGGPLPQPFPLLSRKSRRAEYRRAAAEGYTFRAAWELWDDNVSSSDAEEEEEEEEEGGGEGSKMRASAADTAWLDKSVEGEYDRDLHAPATGAPRCPSNWPCGLVDLCRTVRIPPPPDGRVSEGLRSLNMAASRSLRVL
ncbi:hypothetical protein HYH03_006701 [Edaphochlamys debaryana]|uniref:Uncharacterized protein n=1 Tax=Edaphochlamys debaryana TaxID=47281 RepID=A0A835Y333_9CHLO|nr:hypothetical protein HYH03_006701 [Edaphochlamys debaryana]|eukprot:KAG2495090.1 hypothetical protein HYH03_006701 [Edaphochlamys debaryana]